MFPNELSVFEDLGYIDEILHTRGHATQAYMKTPKGRNLAVSNLKYEYPIIYIHLGEFAVALRNTIVKIIPTRMTMRLMDKYFSYDVRKVL